MSPLRRLTVIDFSNIYKNFKLHQKNQFFETVDWTKLIQTDAMMISKINYIHHNPVKRGYVDNASHWRYSSARDYEGVVGLLDVERFW